MNHYYFRSVYPLLSTHHSQSTIMNNSAIKIDSHQHFWKFDPVRDSWITDEMAVIKKDFLPEDLKPILQKNNIEGSIAVQTEQVEIHNNYLLDLASENNFIKGVVGWVDLQASNVRERLAFYKSFGLMKGFRHILQGEKDRAMMLKPAFMNGITALKEFDYTYDILIYPDQLQFTEKFVAAFPDQKFVIDHIAKPNIRDKRIVDWRNNIEAFAPYENVYCKISGMVTEAGDTWKREDFKPYLDIVLETFGTGRIMYGSDWPVCLVAASYKGMIDIVKNYFSSFSKDENEKFFGLNAITFYNL
jgi:L-fucono-1,5-lactonase